MTPMVDFISSEKRLLSLAVLTLTTASVTAILNSARSNSSFLRLQAARLNPCRWVTFAGRTYWKPARSSSARCARSGKSAATEIPAARRRLRMYPFEPLGTTNLRKNGLSEKSSRRSVASECTVKADCCTTIRVSISPATLATTVGRETVTLFPIENVIGDLASYAGGVAFGGAGSQ
jgi:hypothetical protein